MFPDSLEIIRPNFVAIKGTVRPILWPPLMSPVRPLPLKGPGKEIQVSYGNHKASSRELMVIIRGTGHAISHDVLLYLFGSSWTQGSNANKQLTAVKKRQLVWCYKRVARP